MENEILELLREVKHSIRSLELKIDENTQDIAKLKAIK